MTNTVSACAQTLNGAKAHLLPNYMSMIHNLYDEDENPNGIYNLEVAENELCETEITKKLNQTTNNFTKSMNYYGDPLGELSLRQALCDLFQVNLQITKRMLNVDRMIITSGAARGFVM